MEQHEKNLGGIKSIIKSDAYFKIKYDTEELGRIYIVNGHTFRYYVSTNKHFQDFPIPNDKEDVAKIITKSVAEYDTVPFDISVIQENDDSYIIDAEHIQICFNKEWGTMTVKDKRNDKEVLKEAKPISFANKTTQVLVHHGDEHFFGGGMQNGRFAHKGDVIEIVNTNSWTDGGVTSPNPFYWSSYGYGVLSVNVFPALLFHIDSV